VAGPRSSLQRRIVLVSGIAETDWYGGETMVAPGVYRSRFENRYGEAWEFEYDPVKGEGLLRGSDVDWQEYRVLDGHVPGLILNDEEIRWLRTEWQKATGER
jgi:hypothetical protein